jgi:(2Fe-2S) ferredoxin
LVAQTGCLYPCNLGPVMVVYPEGVWYGTLDNNTVEQIVQEHFVAGQVVADFCYHRANQS